MRNFRSGERFDGTVQQYEAMLTRQREKDAKHLQWIHDRLVSVHGEDALLDYMRELRAVIERLDGHGR